MTSSSESSGSGEDTDSESEKSMEDGGEDIESSLEEKPKMKPYLWPAESSYGYTSGDKTWFLVNLYKWLKYNLPLFA